MVVVGATATVVLVVVVDDDVVVGGVAMVVVGGAVVVGAMMLVVVDVVVGPRSSSAKRLASAGSRVNAPEQVDWRTDDAIVPFENTHIPMRSSTGADVVVGAMVVVEAVVWGLLFDRWPRTEVGRVRVVSAVVVVAGSTNTVTSSGVSAAWATSTATSVGPG